MIASEVISSRRREKIWSGLTSTRRSICSFGRIVSPVTLTLEILYCSPSVTPAVMNMSWRSGLIETCVESTAEVDVAAVEVPGVELLQVAGELLARVLVVAAVPATASCAPSTPTSRRSVSSSNFSLPTRLMWRIFAALPSLTLIVMSTRLRSSRETVGLISTLYLPRLLYWRVSSCVTRSSARRSKVSPSDRPISFRPLSQVLGLDVLVAGQGELVDRRTLDDGDDEDVALAVEVARPRRSRSCRARGSPRRRARRRRVSPRSIGR